MPTKEMYILAKHFQTRRLWDVLDETDLFAIQPKDGGEMLYCSVRGTVAGDYSLSVYVGENGLHNYLMERQETAWTWIDSHERIYAKCALMCSFESRYEMRDEDRKELRAYGLRYRGENAWPAFRKYETYKYAHPVTEDSDCLRLTLAMKAALCVSDRLKSGAEKGVLGFTGGRMPFLTATDEAGEDFMWFSRPTPSYADAHFPSPAPQNTILIQRVKKMPQQLDQAIAADLVMVRDAVLGSPSYHPVVLLLLNSSGRATAQAIVKDYDRDCALMLDSFLEYVAEKGKPEVLHACNKRVYDLLKNTADLIGIPIVLEQIEAMETARRMFLRQMLPDDHEMQMAKRILDFMREVGAINESDE